jgi:hypothetical protein
MPPMILKVNLAACALFFLGVFGVVGLVGGLPWTSAQDAAWPLAFTSPIVIWSAGAWLLKRHGPASFAWLTASIVLMAVQLLAVYVDVDAARRERMTRQETMHLAAFLALLLHWFVALVLLAAAGLVRLLAGDAFEERGPLPTD